MVKGAHEIASLTPPILRFGLALLCATSGTGDFHKQNRKNQAWDNPQGSKSFSQSQTGSVLQISGNPVMPYILHKDGEGPGKPCTMLEGTGGSPLPLAQDSLRTHPVPTATAGAGKEGL